MSRDGRDMEANLQEASNVHVCYDVDRTLFWGHLCKFLEIEKEFDRTIFVDKVLNSENKDTLLRGLVKDFMQHEDLRTLQKGFKNKEQITAHITRLMDNGAYVSLTSYTQFEEILPFVLEEMGLTPAQIEKIQIVGGYPVVGGVDKDEPGVDIDIKNSVGKNNHIKIAQEKHDITDRSIKTVLTDDDETNCKKAAEMGGIGIHVPDTKGNPYRNVYLPGGIVIKNVHYLEVMEHVVKAQEEKKDVVEVLKEYNESVINHKRNIELDRGLTQQIQFLEELKGKDDVKLHPLIEKYIMKLSDLLDDKESKPDKRRTDFRNIVSNFVEEYKKEKAQKATISSSSTAPEPHAEHTEARIHEYFDNLFKTVTGVGAGVFEHEKNVKLYCTGWVESKKEFMKHVLELRDSLPQNAEMQYAKKKGGYSMMILNPVEVFQTIHNPISKKEFNETYNNNLKRYDFSHVFNLRVYEGESSDAAIKRIKHYVGKYEKEIIISQHDEAVESKKIKRLKGFARMVNKLDSVIIDTEQLVEELNSGETIVVNSGWKGHTTSMTIKSGSNYDYVAVVNRGAGRHDKGTTIVCKVKKGVVNKELLDKISDSRLSADRENYFSVIKELTGEGDENIIAAINQTNQKTGICSWTNSKAGYLAYLTLEENFETFEALTPPYSVMSNEALFGNGIKMEYDNFANFTRQEAKKELFEAPSEIRNEIFAAYLTEHIFSDNPFNLDLREEITSYLLNDSDSLAEVISYIAQRGMSFDPAKHEKYQKYTPRAITALCLLKGDVENSDLALKEELITQINSHLKYIKDNNSDLGVDVSAILTKDIATTLDNRYMHSSHVGRKLSYMNLLQKEGFDVSEVLVDLTNRKLYEKQQEINDSINQRIEILCDKKTEMKEEALIEVLDSGIKQFKKLLEDTTCDPDARLEKFQDLQAAVVLEFKKKTREIESKTAEVKAPEATTVTQEITKKPHEKPVAQGAKPRPTLAAHRTRVESPTIGKRLADMIGKVEKENRNLEKVEKELAKVESAKKAADTPLKKELQEMKGELREGKRKKGLLSRLRKLR